MESYDESLVKKGIRKKGVGKSRINLEKDSLQYNAQDLNQEQKLDMNPVQSNVQNLRIFVKNDRNNYSGKMTGITYLEENKNIVKNAEILLFFGSESKLPVYKTNSDNNGNFLIEDIPPGYYILRAKYGKYLKYESHIIKVFGGHIVHQSVLFRQ